MALKGILDHIGGPSNKPFPDSLEISEQEFIRDKPRGEYIDPLPDLHYKESDLEVK